MKLMIEIDEERYSNVKNQVKNGIDNPLKVIIANGTQLPKGHGRLVDADRLEQIQNDRLQNGEIRILELKLITSALDEAETVVEADGGDAE